MDDEFLEDTFNQAIETGNENKWLLQLAAGWCENIGVEKGLLGTGTLELVTGLPITGGSLRCDFARAPTSYAMGLKNNALEFYEANCIGCRDRKPTDATEHLGTWADPQITEREEQRRQQEEKRKEEAEARLRRQKKRRLIHGAPDPTLQSILNLVDRIDAEESDRDAEKLLLKHAELSPGDFPDDLIDHLTTEAIAIGKGGLLEAVIAIFERQGKPTTCRMLAVAFEAVGREIASIAAGRVIAVHAESFDVDKTWLDGILRLAAGKEDPTGHPYRTDFEHTALIRFFDVDPDRAVRHLSAKLNDEDVWCRAMAAHAAARLIGPRPQAGLALLPALLDAISLPDKSLSLGDPFAASEAMRVVADILEAHPHDVAREIDARMQNADGSYARDLWHCYDSVARSHRDEEVPGIVAEIIFDRGHKILRENRAPELLREVSSTLATLARFRGASQGLLLPEAVTLLLLWAGRSETQKEASKAAFDAATSPEERQIIFSESWDSEIASDSILRDLKVVVETCATRQATEYLDLLLDSAWKKVTSSPKGRVFLLDILGVALRDQGILDRVVPMLLGVLGSDEPSDRAAALGVFEQAGRKELVLPNELPSFVLALLLDDECTLAAIGVLDHLDVLADRKPDVINRLLWFVQACSPQRIYSDYVQNALFQVARLARGEPYEGKAGELVLRVVAAFPSGESADLLGRLPLRNHPHWPEVACRALYSDTDPRYYGLHDDDRERLLRDLAELPTGRIAPFFGELEKVGLERLPQKRAWAWAVADVLAFHGQHSGAATICDAVVDGLADTREQGPARRFARQVALGHHLNFAIAEGDVEARERWLAEWSKLADQRKN